MMCLIGIASLIVYVFFFPYKTETGEKGLYCITTLYRWLPYFDFMLFGAWIGMKRSKIKVKPMLDGILFIISLFLFYVVQYEAKKDVSIATYQIVTLIPLIGIIFYFYKLCNINVLKKYITNNLDIQLL